MTSKLEELIAKLCPNGVEYKTIGTICETLKKATLKKGELKSEGYPVINSGRTLYGYYDKYNNEGPAFTVAARGEYAAFVNYFDKRFWAGGLCYPYKSKDESKTLTKFIYYSLKNIQQRIRDGIVAEGSIPALNKSDFENIKLLVPPLEVQREIVRILDNFTELTENLTAELTARKKQYEYYRDTLLTFNDNNPLHSLISRYSPNGVEYKKIGDIATIVRGASPRPIMKFITNSLQGVNWIKIGDVNSGDKYITHTAEKITLDGAKKSRLVKKGDFILSNSMSFGRPYILKIDGCIHDGWLAISDFSATYMSDFLYYVLSSSNCQNDMRKKASFGGAVKNLNADIVRELILPVPPLEVQRQIVQILDRFDALCNDLTQGLPAEIEARRKQYEYYRDQLLTFKRA